MLTLAACHPEVEGVEGADRPEGGRLQIQVVNYPLAYFVERVGSTEVDVTLAAPQGGDPAYWQPSNAELSSMRAADLIVLNGAGYSAWAGSARLPESKVLDTSESFRTQFLEADGATAGGDGRKEGLSREGEAFTTWIDFQQAIRQAGAICRALQRGRSEQIELFALNYDDLKRDLLALDRDMLEVGENLGGQPIVASRPVFQYLARRYRFNLRSVSWDSDAVPTDDQIDGLKRVMEGHAAKWMLWDKAPPKQAAAKLAAIGLSSVVFDPCSDMPAEGNWLSVMKANVSRMREAAGSGAAVRTR